MRERIVILQDAIMAYRRPVYNRLADDYEVWVVHSGAPSVRPDDRYREVIVPAITLGGFRLQPVGAALERLQPIKAVLAIFDLRWPLTLWGAWRLRRARRLLWGHRRSRHSMVNLLREALMRRFDGMIQYGEEEIPRMIAAGISRDRIFIAPNTIDVPNHADLSAASKSSLLYVGRLQPRKRLEELIDAFAAIVPEIPRSIGIELVGDGDVRTALEKQARRLGVADRVVFHGTLTDPDALRPIFERALAYVSPDNVGLGLLHAFAYGVPVVTSTPRSTAQVGYRHGPEFQNLRAGENGLLFTDADELQAHLLAIVNEPGLAQRLGRNAYADYSTYRSIDAMAAGICAAVENLPHGVRSGRLESTRCAG